MRILLDENSFISLHLLDFIKVLFGIYFAYSAISGKGRLFDTKHLKCTVKTYMTVMRILCAFGAVAMMASGVCEFFLDEAEHTVLLTVLMIATLVSLLLLVIVNYALTDSAAAKAEAERKDREARGKAHPLRAAFVFDEEDEKPDGAQNDDSADADKK